MQEPILHQKPFHSIFIQPNLSSSKVDALPCLRSYQMENYGETDHGLLQTVAAYLSIVITNVEKFEKALKNANYDYLSNLYNRSALMHFGDEALRRAYTSNSAIGVLIADIDDFKKINDQYGHLKGDEVIAKVSETIKNNARHGIASRYGGEEFVLIIDRIQKEEFLAIAESIRKTCSSMQIETNTYPIHFTICVGVYYANNIESLDDVIHKADQALYFEKKSGKNCVKSFNDLHIQEKVPV